MLKKSVLFNMSRVNRVPISRSASGWVTATFSRVFAAPVGLLRPGFSRIQINYCDLSPRWYPLTHGFCKAEALFERFNSIVED